MTQLNNYLNFLKNNLTLSITLIYIVSFINYFIYYSSFDIPISNYIELTDLLFFFFDYVIQILLIIFFAEITLFIIHSFYFKIFHIYLPLIVNGKILSFLGSNKHNKKRYLKILEINFGNNLWKFKMAILIFSMFFISKYPLKLIIIPSLFFYSFYLLNQIDRKKTQNLTLYLCSLTVIIGLALTTINNLINKRFNKDETAISFMEGEQIISTNKQNSNLNYLGETSKYLFIFDIKTKTTKIFPKESITNLQIENSHNLLERFGKLITR